LDASLPSSSLGTPTRRLWWLGALLAAESLLALSLHTLGWFETGGLLRQAGCALLALLPLAAAIYLVARRRFRFNMRTMLIATALLAAFLGISVFPLFDAVASRRGALALAATGIDVRDYCSNDEYFLRDGHDPRPPAPPRPAVRPLPIWLRPLAGEALRLPVDAAVREVKVNDDAQAFALAANIARLPSLTYVGVNTRGLSPPGVAAVFATLPQASQLVQYHMTCPVPPGMLRQARSVRCIWIDSGSRLVNAIGPEVLNDLAALPELQHLDMRHVRISDADLQLLAKSASLRRIVLRAEGPTPAGVDRLEASMPDCRITIVEPYRR
jgi:hypothetical protein